MIIEDNDLELLSISKAARYLKINRGSIRDLINEGKIGTIRIRKSEKISKHELKKFVSENEIKEKRLIVNPTKCFGFNKKMDAANSGLLNGRLILEEIMGKV